MPATVPVIGEVGYTDIWCLITNAADTDEGWLYAQPYWQEAAFRDLKSEGWQWQPSRVWTPDHANRLLLGMTLAYAWSLPLGALALDDPHLARQVAKLSHLPYSLFRGGLRLFDHFFYRQDWSFFLAPPHLSFA